MLKSIYFMLGLIQELNMKTSLQRDLQLSKGEKAMRVHHSASNGLRIVSYISVYTGKEVYSIDIFPNPKIASIFMTNRPVIQQANIRSFANEKFTMR